MTTLDLMTCFICVIFSVLGFFDTNNTDISDMTLLLYQLLSNVITEDCKSAAKVWFYVGGSNSGLLWNTDGGALKL